MDCRVVHGGSLPDTFRVLTGVRQGCLPSQFLFLLTRITLFQWVPHSPMSPPYDPDLSDDLATLMTKCKRKPIT